MQVNLWSPLPQRKLYASLPENNKEIQFKCTSFRFDCSLKYKSELICFSELIWSSLNCSQIWKQEPYDSLHICTVLYHYKLLIYSTIVFVTGFLLHAIRMIYFPTGSLEEYFEYALYPLSVRLSVSPSARYVMCGAYLVYYIICASYV